MQEAAERCNEDKTQAKRGKKLQKEAKRGKSEGHGFESQCDKKTRRLL